MIRKPIAMVLPKLAAQHAGRVFQVLALLATTVALSANISFTKPAPRYPMRSITSFTGTILLLSLRNSIAITIAMLALIFLMVSSMTVSNATSVFIAHVLRCRGFANLNATSIPSLSVLIWRKNQASVFVKFVTLRPHHLAWPLIVLIAILQHISCAFMKRSRIPISVSFLKALIYSHLSFKRLWWMRVHWWNFSFIFLMRGKLLFSKQDKL